jgi:hypothetical protein
VDHGIFQPVWGAVVLDIYTLTRGFLPRYLISEFTSAIWTERYFSAGDIQLVVPAIPSMIQKLAPGTFLGLRGTKEIMIAETQSIENSLLTVSGSSLPNFLDEREAWFQSPTAEAPYVSQFVATTTAGQHISNAVDKMVINPANFPSGWPTNVNLDWARDKILNLQLGVIDANGVPKELSFDLGPLYTSIQHLAEEEGLGFKLYLDSATYSTSSYVLKFATYRGKNRTSEQTVHQMVRLTPKMDSLSDVKEISSISSYKNVVYVTYKNVTTVHYLYPDAPIPTGFDRRVLRVDAPDLYFVDDRIPAFREQVARNAFANHIYIQAVDGRVSTKIPYLYGTDYGLGDVVELEGFTNIFSKARITEYIRAQDEFGERDYPTLAVIDPLQTGYMPDLEPDPDFDPDWDDSDPEYDMDIPSDSTDPDFDPDDHLPDPPDYNPDPDPEFPADEGGTGGGGGGGGSPYDETGVLGDCLTLHAHNISADGECIRWYSHGGRVYLEGTVYYGATGDPGGNITTSGALPVAARPASDVSVTIYPDATNSDKMYGEFTSFAGTIHSNGTITISPAPWTSFDGFDLYLMLGNISWPKGVSVTDVPDKELLNPWLVQNLPFGTPPGVQPAATPVGAKIGVHGMRTHLFGAADLVEPVYGNLIQLLPPSYRAARFDRIAVHGGGNWYPGVVDQDGALTLTNQRSKPLLRAKSLDDWALGIPWEATAIGDADHFSFVDEPMQGYFGGALSATPIFLQGRWTRPLSLLPGSEFGFVMAYGYSGLGAIHYQLTARKMDASNYGGLLDNQWWMMFYVYRTTVAGDIAREYPMVRLDTDSFPGDLPNGLIMHCDIQDVGSSLNGFEQIEVGTTFGGHRYSRLWPDDEEDVEDGIWPSDISASNVWGAVHTYATSDPVSTLTDITGDYFIPSGINSGFEPPSWLPNGGLPSAGQQFNLNNLGWRVPWEAGP